MTRFAKLFIAFTLVLSSCFLIGYGAATGFSKYTASLSTSSNSNQQPSHNAIITELTTPTNYYSNNKSNSYTDDYFNDFTNNNTNNDTYVEDDVVDVPTYNPNTNKNTNNNTANNNNANTNNNQNVNLTESKTTALYNLVNPSSEYYVNSAEFQNFKLDFNIKVKKSKTIDLDIDIKAQIEKTQSGLPNILAELNCKVITKTTTTNVDVDVYIKQNICYVNVLGSKYSFNLNRTVTKVSELVSYVLDYVKDFDLVKEISKAVNAVKTNENYLTFKENLYNNTKSFTIKVPAIVNGNVVNETIITLKDNKFSTLNYTNTVSTNVCVQLNMSLNSSPISFPCLNDYFNIF